MQTFRTYILKRLLLVPVGVFVVVSLSFLFVNAIPSDPARQLVGDGATAQEYAAARHSLGLDKSLIHRYLLYLQGIVLHGSLGHSYFTNRPVLNDMADYLPNTLELIVPAFAVAALLGIALGSGSAFVRGRLFDQITRVIATLAQAIPDFFLGLILIFVLFYKLNLVASPTGQLGLLDIPPPPLTHVLIIDSIIRGDWGISRSAVDHLVLPVLTLGIAYSGFFALTTRTAMSAALGSHQVEFAVSSGLPRRKVFAYAFMMARTAIITYGAIIFSGLVGGAAIVESIFSWGGIGQFAINRIQQLDLPEIQGCVLVFALITLVMLLLLDVSVALLDPRIRYG